MINNDDNRDDRGFYSKAVITELGTWRFGPPSSEIQRTLERVNDITHLKALFERLFTAKSWFDLFEHRTEDKSN